MYRQRESEHKGRKLCHETRLISMSSVNAPLGDLSGTLTKKNLFNWGGQVGFPI